MESRQKTVKLMLLYQPVRLQQFSQNCILAILALCSYLQNIHVQYSDGVTPLFCAVNKNQNKPAIYLMQKGADVNLCRAGPLRQTILHVAAEFGNMEVVDCLIKPGANVNVLDSNGVTPLSCSVHKDQNGAAINLIQSGSDVNLCRVGPLRQTIVHVAAHYGNLQIMDCLIKAGANVNVQCSDGLHPLSGQLLMIK
jgi:ankyrin repeat protein